MPRDHWMRLLPWLIAGAAVLAALVAGPSWAAPIDCAHVHTPDDQAVCADPRLRAADAAMDRAFRALLAVSLDELEDAAEQRDIVADWTLQHLTGPQERDQRLAAYRARIAALRELEAAWRALRAPIPQSALAAACVRLPGSRTLPCRVAGYGQVPGSDSQTILFQVQSYGSPDEKNGGIAFFRPAPGGRIVMTAGLYVPGTKFGAENAVKQTPSGARVLDVRGTNDAATRFVQWAYMVEPDSLRELEPGNWLGELTRRLPAGTILCDQPILIDFRRLRFRGTLCRDGDPTTPGDDVDAQLALAGRRIRLESLQYKAHDGP